MRYHIDPTSIIPCEPPTIKNFKPLTGKIFDQLTVVGFAGKRIDKCGKIKYYWHCVCSCGRAAVACRRSLVLGEHTSCGCKWMERLMNGVITHSSSYTPEYKIWSSMRQRCSNPKAVGWINYGGRGIKVCERWEKFENFIQDMGTKPTKNHSIERIDNNGDYGPSNCRWIPKQLQPRNTRRTIFLTFNGQTKPLFQWAEELSISYQTLFNRLDSGWTTERILGRPVGRWPR